MSDANQGKRAGADLGRTSRLLAVMLLLLAGWFGWSAYSQWRNEAIGVALEEARDAAVVGLHQAMTEQAAQMTKVLALAEVKAALAGGDADAAAVTVRSNWPGAEDVQVMGSALDVAYADAANFGYSRLALLETALRDQKPAVRVVRDAGSQRLGVAAPAELGKTPAVVYVRLPLQRLTSVFDGIHSPGSAYLALRQGNHNVVEQGNSAIGAGGAEALARPVGDTGLRVAAAMPDVEPGPLGMGVIPCAIVAALLALVAVLLLLGPERFVRRKKVEVEAETGPTLRESLEQEPLPVAASTRTEGGDSGVGIEVAPGIFRAYDIRGVVGSELTPAVATLIGQAIGSMMQGQGLRDIVVGRDGRLSGPELSEALIEGLRLAGCDVIDIGLAPTPVVYFASYHLRAGSCVAVTGSHNPPDYNGFKVVIGGETLSGATITEIYQRISEGRLHLAAHPGSVQQREVDADYIQRIADDVQLDRPLKVVVDAGNGVAGEIGPRLLEAIGAEVIPLYCDVDGTFPNHHPDPSDPRNLEDLVQTVRRFDADLGLAFDGDGDRLGVVTREGRVIFADRLLMLFAADVLQRNPGALVIYDVKCSGKLSDYVLRHGGSPLMWKTGHSLIKAKMRETDAELAGEMSGHFFFKERWYGFDDGLYAAARLLEVLAQREEEPSEVLGELPDSVSSPEIKVPVEAGTPHALVGLFVAAAQAEESPFAGARLSTIDGLRADFSDGWGLLRASNTTPVLVLRFEAVDNTALERIKDLFRSQLQSLLPGIETGF